MPEEIVFLSFITIVSATFLILMMTRMILRHKSEGKGVKSGSGASMTTSELERMVRRVVEDATTPITHKLDELGKRLGEGEIRQLAAPRSENFLDLEEEEIDVEPVRSRSRERS